MIQIFLFFPGFIPDEPVFFQMLFIFQQCLRILLRTAPHTAVTFLSLYRPLILPECRT